MLVKIANAPYREMSNSNSYRIFDDVTEILNLTTNPRILRSNEELEAITNSQHPRIPEGSWEEISILDEARIVDIIGHPQASLVGSTEAGKDTPLSAIKGYRVNSLSFVSRGIKYSIKFDTIAYICNDKGETLEKSFAGGVVNN